MTAYLGRLVSAILPSPFRTSAVIGLAVYLLSSLVWLGCPWLVGYIPEALAPYAAALLGPPVTLVWGQQAVPFYVSVSLFLIGCVALSRWTYLRYPHSESFAFWLALAAFVWLVSGWLSWAASI